ncbi:MAG: protein kinase [Pirellulaceae bacterium]|nr:protein kinase [Pirellulaceae bacterium]
MCPAACPSRQQLNEFLVGTLPPDDADTISAHLESCTTCQESLQTLDDGQDSLIGLLRQPAPRDEYAAEPARGRLVDAAKGLLAATAAGGGRTTTVVPDDQTIAATTDLGEYELFEKLGQGGMGAVYKARQKKLKRIVAIKLLPKERLADPKAVARFEREMEAVGAVDHPNIVRAMYAGEHDGTPYLAIEYVDGWSLTEVVTTLKTLPIADACELMRQAAIGLQHAHEKRLVHRDIKPSNLMLTREGTVKVLDLGLALLHTPASRGAEMTAAGSMMGTADYVAPEQVTDSHTVDIRADIYSLGCTLYKLLSGRAPFVGPEYKNDLIKIMAHVQKTPPPIAQLRSDIPADLVAVLERMMAKDPAERYATPAEVAAALAPFAAGADLRRLASATLHSIDPAASPDAPSRHTDNASGSPVTDTATSHPPVAQPVTASATAQPRSAADRRWPPRTIAIGLAAVAASFLIVALGVIVLRIRDQAGRETVITLPDDSHIVVEQGGKPVFDSGKPGEEKPDGMAKSPVQQPTEPVDLLTQPLRSLWGDPEPLQIEPGQALSPTALVTQPARLPGLRSWTIETGQVRGWVNCIAYSPDSKWLAVSSTDRLIRIWDTSNGVLRKVLVSPTSDVGSLSWSPSGNELAAAGGEAVRIWDVEFGIVLETINSSLRRVECVAWSPDGATIAFGCRGGFITLWDVKTRQAVRNLAANTDVLAVSWHPRDQILASGGIDNRVRLWDTHTGELLNLLEGHTHHVDALAWSPEGKILASGQAYGTGDVRLWLASSAEFIHSIPSVFGMANGIAWSPDGKNLLLRAGHARIWDTVLRKFTVSSPAIHEVGAVAYAPDGSTFACGNMWGIVWICDAKTGEILHEVSAVRPSGLGASVDWSQDGQFLAIGSEPGFMVWETNTAQLRHFVELFQGYPANTVAWSPIDNRLACSGHNFLQVWNGETGEESSPIKFGAGGPAWHPDGSKVAAFDGSRTVGVYDAKTAERLREFDFGRNQNNSGAVLLSWSADGSMLAAGARWRLMTVFDADTGERKKTITEDSNLNSLAWSLSGNLLAYGGRPLTIWDSASDRIVWEFQLDNYVKAWSPDSAFLLVDGSIWNVAEKKQIASLTRHTGKIASPSFSRDGRVLATAADDSTVGLWNTKTWQPHGTVVLLPNSRLAIMADGNYRGTPDADRDIVMVALTDDGQQLTLTPAEFAARYAWQNDPSKVTLLPAD